jgi:putative ATPase
MGLFDDEPPAGAAAPLADRMRPRRLDELVGQEAILGPGSALRRAIETDAVRSLILWGPPGSGKTSLARILATTTRARFVPFSAVLGGLKEIREILDAARRERRGTGRRTILFVDEIHRFNRAQQDAFLPWVETGDIVLVGATTENPSFEVNAALLSRSRVYRLERLDAAAIVTLLERALADPERGLGRLRLEVDPELLVILARRCQGDARAALNALEVAAEVPPGPDGARRIDLATLEDALQRGALYHDRAGEEHFNLISALHKSMRNSDPDATLYWLGRILEAGDDPLYVARRIVRFAAEDVGLADPRALPLAMAAQQAMHFVGRPEADLCLAEAAVYGALAPKSNALYAAWGKVLETIRGGATGPVPLHLRNAPTDLMKAEGYGQGYLYAHDLDEGVADMPCLPGGLEGTRFYEPRRRGLERRLLARIEALRKRR